jgi:hypothetical protein
VTDQIAPPVEGDEVAPRYEHLRWLNDTYGQIQKQRVAADNRIRAATQGEDTNQPHPIASFLSTRLADIEKELFNEMKDAVKDHPAWPWLSDIKGVGPTLATKVLGLILDIERFPTVAKLWKFSGYGLNVSGEPYDPDYAGLYELGTDIVPLDRNGRLYTITNRMSFDEFTGVYDIDTDDPDSNLAEYVANPSEEQWPVGKGTMFYLGSNSDVVYIVEVGGPDTERQRPKKGEKLSYNVRLKTALYLVGDSFIKSRSPYRDLYDRKKEYYRLTKQIQPLKRLMPEEIELGGIPDRGDKEGKKQWDKMIREANKRAGESHDGAVWIDAHVDNAARRYMVKIFLSHLWEVWRKEEGLPVREPYAITNLGHQTKFDPWTFTKTYAKEQAEKKQG